MPLTLPRGKPSPIWLAVLLWLAGALNPLHAQLIANFTPNRTGGCSPLAVIFQNTTTGAGPGAIYSWNFGNGNSITTTDGTLPVAATYSIGQVYTVTLSVQYGGQTSTKSININVYKPPVVNFQGTNTLGCQPLSSSFTSSSTPGDGFITSYFWDFGDGITLNTTSSNVNHIYNFTGIFTVGLTVTNSDGCTSTFQRVN
ncbi:MAG: PKD domain-containing protein, partial [Chitinophagales bacterium]